MLGSEGATSTAPIEPVAFMVEDRRPGPAEIRGLPYAAVHDADVEDIRLSGHARDGTGAASAERPDVAPMQLAQQFGAYLLALGWSNEAKDCKQEKEGRYKRVSLHQ